MTFELALMIIYRLLALAVAVMMVLTLLRERHWHDQVFATIVLIPFALRAAGIK
jgi:hypothetical protein